MLLRVRWRMHVGLVAVLVVERERQAGATLVAAKRKRWETAGSHCSRLSRGCWTSAVTFELEFAFASKWKTPLPYPRSTGRVRLSGPGPAAEQFSVAVASELGFVTMNCLSAGAGPTARAWPDS